MPVQTPVQGHGQGAAAEEEVEVLQLRQVDLVHPNRQLLPVR